VLGDSAYSAGEFRAELAARGSTAVIKPAPLMRAIPGGFTVDDFVVDLESGTVTCPGPTPSPLLERVPPCSERAAAAALCAIAAPPHGRARRSGCTHITRCSRLPGSRRRRRGSRPSTDRTGPWWNDPELAGSPRAPHGGLPQDQPQPNLVEPPSCGSEPPTIAQPRLASGGGGLGGGLKATIPPAPPNRARPEARLTTAQSPTAPPKRVAQQIPSRGSGWRHLNLSDRPAAWC
jgi:hypothetical protein